VLVNFILGSALSDGKLYIPKYPAFCPVFQFSDYQGVMRRKVKNDRQRDEQKKKGQKDKQRSTKHYTERKEKD
jgi:hypothetical protein